MKALPWILAGVGIGVAAYVITTSPSPRYATGSEDVEEAAARTSLWGSKQRLTGTGGSLLGKAKQGLGKITGNDQLAGEGAVDEAAGTVKDVAGQAAHAVSSTIHDINV